MPCVRCNSSVTIKAHLIPRVFCTEVQVGKAHASVSKDGSYHYTQSGRYDSAILCAECDSILGELENYAYHTLKILREHLAEHQIRRYGVSGVDCDKFLRFLAGLIWKYSITKIEYGRIELGPYQELCRHLAYREMDIPEEFDAFAFRLSRKANDKEIFAYRAPKLDRIDGLNHIRLMVGGFLIFIKLDKRPIDNPTIKELLLRGKSEFCFQVLPAQAFEEYSDIPSLLHKNRKLDQFLAKQDTLANKS